MLYNCNLLSLFDITLTLENLCRYSPLELKEFSNTRKKRVILPVSTTVHINDSDSCIYSSFFPGSPSHSSPRCCKATNGMRDITTVRTDSLFHCINCELPGTEKGETHSHLQMQILWAFIDWNKWGSLLRAEQESLCVFPPNVLGTQSLHWDEVLRCTQWHESLHLIWILNVANFFFSVV